MLEPPPRRGDRVAVPSHLLDGPGDHYVLRVVGDSMIEVGICDGDFLVVLRCEQAAPGELVVAIFGDDATLKRYYPEGEMMVRLEPANPATQPIHVPASECRIQGIAVGLMRKFRRPGRETTQ